MVSDPNIIISQPDADGAHTITIVGGAVGGEDRVTELPLGESKIISDGRLTITITSATDD